MHIYIYVQYKFTFICITYNMYMANISSVTPQWYHPHIQHVDAQGANLGIGATGDHTFSTDIDAPDFAAMLFKGASAFSCPASEHKGAGQE